MDAAALLAALAGGGPIRQRVMIVVAHPDDETIGLGAQLHRLQGALLVHITDGAPRDGNDARQHGFADIRDYAEARRGELAAALAAGEALAVRSLVLGIPDQEAVHHLPALVRRIADLLRREQPEAVITHAYEGGHPDHDAAAFVVRAACALIYPHTGTIEVPLYHLCSGEMVTGCFPSRRGNELALSLDDAAQQKKRRMIDRFVTQRAMLGQFGVTVERFREAPEYDFRQSPHPGPLLYETWGWKLSGEKWRRRAAQALAEFGLG